MILLASDYKATHSEEHAPNRRRTRKLDMTACHLETLLVPSGCPAGKGRYSPLLPSSWSCPVHTVAPSTRPPATPAPAKHTPHNRHHDDKDGLGAWTHGAAWVSRAPGSGTHTHCPNRLQSVRRQSGMQQQPALCQPQLTWPSWTTGTGATCLPPPTCPPPSLLPRRTPPSPPVSPPPPPIPTHHTLHAVSAR